MSIGAIKSLTKLFNFKKINFNFPRWHSYEHDNWDLLDAILATYVYGGGLRGLWQNSTAYAVNDRLIDADENRAYLCLIAHTSASTPTTFAADRLAHPTYWKAVTYTPTNRGTWATATAYAEDEFVVSGTKYAVVVEDHVSGATFDADVLAGKLHVLIDLALGLSVPTSIIRGRSTAGTGDVENLTGLQAANIIGSIPHGQCRLVKNGANITLFPFNGNKIIINRKMCTIPDVGISLAPTGLTPGTLYYVFVYDSNNDGVADTLEANSSIGHAISNGVEVKSNDATRTFVGLVRPITGPAFQDTPRQRFVRSWFNRKSIILQGAPLNTRVIGGNASEVSTAIRVEALVFSDESSFINASVTLYDANSSIHTYYIICNGNIFGNVFEYNQFGADVVPASFASAATLGVEGYVYFGLTHTASSGTLYTYSYTWLSGMIG